MQRLRKIRNRVSAQILRRLRLPFGSRGNIPTDVYLRDVAPINIDRSNETEKLSKVDCRATMRKYILQKYHQTPIRGYQTSLFVPPAFAFYSLC